MTNPWKTCSTEWHNFPNCACNRFRAFRKCLELTQLKIHKLWNFCRITNSTKLFPSRWRLLRLKQSTFLCHNKYPPTPYKNCFQISFYTYIYVWIQIILNQNRETKMLEKKLWIDLLVPSYNTTNTRKRFVNRKKCTCLIINIVQIRKTYFLYFGWFLF